MDSKVLFEFIFLWAKRFLITLAVFIVCWSYLFVYLILTNVYYWCIMIFDYSNCWLICIRRFATKNMLWQYLEQLRAKYIFIKSNDNLKGVFLCQVDLIVVVAVVISVVAVVAVAILAEVRGGMAEE